MLSHLTSNLATPNKLTQRAVTVSRRHHSTLNHTARDNRPCKLLNTKASTPYPRQISFSKTKIQSKVQKWRLLTGKPITLESCPIWDFRSTRQLTWIRKTITHSTYSQTRKRCWLWGSLKEKSKNLTNLKRTDWEYTRRWLQPGRIEQATLEKSKALQLASLRRLTSKKGNNLRWWHKVTILITLRIVKSWTFSMQMTQRSWKMKLLPGFKWTRSRFPTPTQFQTLVKRVPTLCA